MIGEIICEESTSKKDLSSDSQREEFTTRWRKLSCTCNVNGYIFKRGNNSAIFSFLVSQ